VVEVPEAQGDSAEVFEAPVDGLDGTVGGTHVEVRMTTPFGPAVLF
jgi:hypothetical protein